MPKPPSGALTGQRRTQPPETSIFEIGAFLPKPAGWFWQRFRGDPVTVKIIRPAGFLTVKNPGVSQRIFRLGFLALQMLPVIPSKLKRQEGRFCPDFFLSNFSGFATGSKSWVFGETGQMGTETQRYPQAENRFGFLFNKFN